MVKVCFVHLGLYRTGTSALATSFSNMGLQVCTFFPGGLNKQQLELFHEDPQELVQDWWRKQNGKAFVRSLVASNDLLCGGWIPLLVFLAPQELQELHELAFRDGKFVQFLVLSKDIDDIVFSEIHHCIESALEQGTGLSKPLLEDSIRRKVFNHALAIDMFSNYCKEGPIELQNCLTRVPVEEEGDACLPCIENLLGALRQTYWSNALSEA